jgi:hypothetical protein
MMSSGGFSVTGGNRIGSLDAKKRQPAHQLQFQHQQKYNACPARWKYRCKHNYAKWPYSRTHWVPPLSAKGVNHAAVVFVVIQKPHANNKICSKFHMSFDILPRLIFRTNQAGAGRLPRGMGVARLRDMPAEWSRQHLMLGLPAQ